MTIPDPLPRKIERAQAAARAVWHDLTPEQQDALKLAVDPQSWGWLTEKRDVILPPSLEKYERPPI